MYVLVPMYQQFNGAKQILKAARIILFFLCKNGKISKGLEVIIFMSLETPKLFRGDQPSPRIKKNWYDCKLGKIGLLKSALSYISI